MSSNLFWLVPLSSIAALVLAWYFYHQMKKEDEGTPTMRKIAEHVRTGAMSYLKQQYKIVSYVFLALVVIFAIMAYGFHIQNSWVPIAFLTGGFFSGLSGFLGMKTATYASGRTANAARTSLNKGLKVAFRSGAVMGLVVVGLGLLDISFWYLLLDYCIPEEAMNPTSKLCVITTTMLTFGMGASTQALFARVGGGIYTKAADVGADLVGKVEAGIPEDDPRNPATIADNVGDNVGDVAGMGADLYESYCGSILATSALGAAAFMSSGDVEMQFKAVIAPMLIAAVGILLSILGIFTVRTKENAGMKELLRSLSFGTNLSSVLIVGATFLIMWMLGITNWLYLSFSVVIGLIVGVVIGQSTEYFTSQSYRPTKRLSESGKTGPATVIISGIGLGMISTTIPVIAVVAGIILSYWFASGFDFSNVAMGLYGISIAAVGMLSTLGITLATDAYGPIADNAGGNAEMSGLGSDVRKRTDALDSLGNTTAATGKGFAIGSAALTGLGLLASYIEEIRIGLERAGTTMLEMPSGLFVPLKEATFTDLKHKCYFNFVSGLVLAVTVLCLIPQVRWISVMPFDKEAFAFTYEVGNQAVIGTVCWWIAYTIWNWIFVTDEFSSSIAYLHVGILLAPIAAVLLMMIPELQPYNFIVPAGLWLVFRANSLTVGGIFQITCKDFFEKKFHVPAFDRFVKWTKTRNVQIVLMIINLALLAVPAYYSISAL